MDDLSNTNDRQHADFLSLTEAATLGNGQFDIASLSEEERKKVQELAKQIEVKDSMSILQYGVGLQSEISRFSDTVLDHVRAKDSGEVGQALTELMLKVKEVDTDTLSGRRGGFLSKMPVLGSLVNSGKKLVAQYEKLGSQIETITRQLNKANAQLLKDISLLDTLYEKNREFVRQLDLYIAAGQLKLQELEREVLPELKRKAEASQDPADVQELNDMGQLINRLEKKIHDLILTRMVTIQSAPQIRLVQNNNQVLVEKIQSSILTTVPLWKNQLVIAIGLHRQKQALEVQKQVADTTNELLLKNSELLKMNAIGIAKENERGIVDISTLKKTQANLLETLEETLNIQRQGREKRRQAEAEIEKMQQELKDKLTMLALQRQNHY
ncbi:toxic anion resistance protein [Aneurinibacillus thermoaerophilus]|uniref:toxic anion resistance protein n=1 Tax=Aneurinibacillus TaxID=55079 RepID=UPI00070E59F1|nr:MULTISPECIES: toxic anion resistance protein [Aneurinibacillus]AMA72225.1 tellurium resistance protein [Aneurinibacillus sp. XH2]MED0756062.1 toxic anion resistance protein [Aneurinibacillus thermoaerophilus]MED0759614.1 toxic anion resistance protein [Aneurinibacillus thermoaerophilus]